MSLPQRGPRRKLGCHKPLNFLLKVLYTGMQWKELPIATGTDGKADEKKLDLSVLHGAGANTVAQKRGDKIGYSGHKH